MGNRVHGHRKRYCLFVGPPLLIIILVACCLIWKQQKKKSSLSLSSKRVVLTASEAGEKVELR